MDQMILLKLESALANLYSDTYSIRRIVDSSGIDLSGIDFNSNARNIWHTVLMEADRLDLVKNLLMVVESEYGNNRQFKEACAAYHGTTAQSGGRLIQDQPVGLTYQQMLAQGLLDELASCFGNETDANLLLESINFPSAYRPQFRLAATPIEYWSTICQQIQQGRVADGFEPLLAAAAARLPGNRKLAPYARPK